MNFFEKLALSQGSDKRIESVENDDANELVTEDDELAMKDDELVTEGDKQVTEDDELGSESDEETTTEILKPSKEKSKKKRKPKVKRDLTAGQFYSGLKETMS